jgi:hypothetical protein
MDITPIIVVPVIFATFYGIVHLLVRRQERLLIIEKGQDMPKLQTNTLFSALKLGMFLVGIGFGFLVGNILSHTTALTQEVSYFSMIFIFGGIALIAGHLIEKKKIED